MSDAAHLRELAAQPVKDDEAVGVEIAPVDDIAIAQPGQAPEAQHVEAGTEEGDGARNTGECEEGDLVLDDEHPPCRQLQTGEARRPGRRRP